VEISRLFTRFFAQNVYKSSSNMRVQVLRFPWTNLATEEAKTTLTHGIRVLHTGARGQFFKQILEPTKSSHLANVGISSDGA
jgi:hypothetical protein